MTCDCNKEPGYPFEEAECIRDQQLQDIVDSLKSISKSLSILANTRFNSRTYTTTYSDEEEGD